MRQAAKRVKPGKRMGERRGAGPWFGVGGLCGEAGEGAEVLRVLKLPTACLGGLRGARAGPREGVTLMSDNVRYHGYVMDS